VSGLGLLVLGGLCAPVVHALQCHDRRLTPGTWTLEAERAPSGFLSRDERALSFVVEGRIDEEPPAGGAGREIRWERNPDAGTMLLFSLEEVEDDSPVRLEVEAIPGAPLSPSPQSPMPLSFHGSGSRGARSMGDSRPPVAPHGRSGPRHRLAGGRDPRRIALRRPGVLMRLLVLLAFLSACARPDPCASPGARSTCLEPAMDAEYYTVMGRMYFDTMDSTVDLGGSRPPYAEQVARWEWPPWLKLTAFGREDIIAADTLLTLYPSTVPERDCRAFSEQPFARCRVVFYYEAHEGRGCPIYEEFTFNDAGEITWIEAWSDVDGLRPTASGDPWGEEGIERLSARIPGLGDPEGRIDLNSPRMTAALVADPDVADFVARARDWHAAWIEEYAAAGDDMWEVGCGW
jgi:hypothetical protein